MFYSVLKALVILIIPLQLDIIVMRMLIIACQLALYPVITTSALGIQLLDIKRE